MQALVAENLMTLAAAHGGGVRIHLTVGGPLDGQITANHEGILEVTPQHNGKPRYVNGDHVVYIEPI